MDDAEQIELSVRDEDRPFLRSARDDGWNNAWQMQRPSRFVIAAGSCLRCTPSARIHADLLARIQARGLGERRGEGYGEIALNAPLLAMDSIDTQPAVVTAEHHNNKPLSPVKVTDFSKALQRRAALLAIQRQVDDVELAFRRDIGWTSGLGPKPPNTQLGALRALLEGVSDEAGLTRLRGWHRALGNSPRRAEKWPEPSGKTLSHHLDDPNAIWQTLELTDGPPALPGHNRQTLAADLRPLAIRALWLTAISRQLNENNRSPKQSQGNPEAADGTHA